MSLCGSSEMRHALGSERLGRVGRTASHYPLGAARISAQGRGPRVARQAESSSSGAVALSSFEAGEGLVELTQVSASPILSQARHQVPDLRLPRW